jgi:muramidase (phage lysozyme)/uncharacterized Zn ribbon protein
MVRVPTYERTEKLRPINQQGITVLATPEAFGAGIGRGMQSVARGLDTASNAIAQVQQMKDEATVSDATNRWLKAKDELLYNPETGYANQSGKQAIDGYEGYKRKVESLKSSVANGMSPAQSNLFSQKVQSLEADAVRSGLIKRSAETKNYVIQEHQSAAENYVQQAARTPADEQRWREFIGRGLHEIDGLGVKQGWGEQKLTQARTEYLSNARTQAALQIAQSDPIAAINYATTHIAEMTPDDHLVLLERLKPDLSKAVATDAAKFNASHPAPNQFAAQGLNRDQYALLSVISGTEAHGYDILNGGQRFGSFADHPGFVGAGGTSTAAGRYQFVKGTWKLAAEALGLQDFSPASQDRAAAWLAQRDYRMRTGRDLGSDIAAGNYGAIRAGLRDTWAGIAGLSDKEFARRMNIARSQPVAATEGGVPVGSASAGPTAIAARGPFRNSPTTEDILSKLPAAYQSEIRQSASDGFYRDQAQELSQQKAQREARADGYRLRIANADTSLSVEDINDDAVLDDGDKASLINSLKEKNKTELETQRNVAAFQAGSFVIDPYSEKGRKANDAVWTSMSTVAQPDQLEPILLSQVRQAGVVPTPVINQMRFSMSAGNITGIQQTMQLASRISAVDPTAVSRTPGGGDIADNLSLYQHYTEDMGLSPAIAAERIRARKDPEQMKARAALLDTKRMKDAIADSATENKVRSIFSTGWFSSNPTLGTSTLQSAAIVADYADFLKEAVYDAGGDMDAAGKLAADRFKRIYGTSEFSMGGPKVVTRLPPEKVYPPDANGSWDYIGSQLKAALTADGVAASEQFLVADHDTERDRMAGVPPRYQVYYKDAEGVLQHYRMPFYAEAPSAEEVAAARKAENDRRIAEIEKERQERMQQLDDGRDREKVLDQYLAGPPKTPLATILGGGSAATNPNNNGGN